MSKIIENEYGKVIISKEVIATLAGTAVVECAGITGMASQNLKQGIVELIGKETLSKGVQVILKNEQVNINVAIIVSYGTKIHEVAQEAMDKVRFTVEKYTGIAVNHIHIHVQGVKVVD